jgi:hypothetical protein
VCANCVSKADVIVGTIAFGAYVFRDPVKAGLVELGILPEPHPLAVEMRTVSFLRDLDLDPNEILGDEVVDAVDTARAWKPAKVYRRGWARDVLGAILSQRVPATV